MKKGAKYLFRSVTHYYTGRIVKVTKTWIHLDQAAWIADTGRFSDALESGNLNEVEPFPGGVILAKGAIVDASPWNHDLPVEKK